MANTLSSQGNFFDRRKRVRQFVCTHEFRSDYKHKLYLASG
jgi:hypothetical protein